MLMRAIDSCYERSEGIKYEIRKETDPYRLEKLKSQFAVEKRKIDALKKQLTIETKMKELKKMDQNQNMTVREVAKLIETFVAK